MPTDNRSSNTEMVSFPRELSDDLAELIATRARVCGGGAFEIWEAICEGFGKPAEKHQGEPLAWIVHWAEDGSFYTFTRDKTRSEKLRNDPEFISTPLYTHADPGEVERLRAELAEWKKRCQYNADTAHDVGRERDTLRAQLAEQDSLLREVLEAFKLETDGSCINPGRDFIRPWAAKLAALSSSAEPSAPIAWHVGGNGYDRICFEKPDDLPGRPCIQAIHDQRQLIDLLKRYDLRDEDVPPDERAHGIPGTSFQRLNALANQGE